MEHKKTSHLKPLNIKRSLTANHRTYKDLSPQTMEHKKDLSPQTMEHKKTSHLKPWKIKRPHLKPWNIKRPLTSNHGI
jgi:hypothetical protein